MNQEVTYQTNFDVKWRFDSVHTRHHSVHSDFGALQITYLLTYLLKQRGFVQT